jgi:uncharacterized protein
MRVLRLSPALLLLAACQPGASSADANAPSASQPPEIAQSADAVPAGEPATPPGFDCAQGKGEIEKAVCADPELAALDRQLDHTYAQALAKANQPAVLRASQRGWIKGRDDCWKSGNDAAACARDAYVARIVELRIDGGLVAAPAAVTYRCSGSDTPLTAAFHNDAPAAVVLTYGSDRAIVPSGRSASGARYAAKGVEFWEHQGEARVDFFGTRLTCTPQR